MAMSDLGTLEDLSTIRRIGLKLLESAYLLSAKDRGLSFFAPMPSIPVFRKPRLSHPLGFL